jgi:hypothetical protein
MFAVSLTVLKTQHFAEIVATPLFSSPTWPFLLRFAHAHFTPAHPHDFSLGASLLSQLQQKSQHKECFRDDTQTDWERREVAARLADRRSSTESRRRPAVRPPTEAANKFILLIQLDS